MLADKLKSAVSDQRMFSKHDVVVVAVSGGPDSVAMLHCLWSLREELAIHLHVAHLDHRLRGCDSAADARYVGELAKTLGLDCTIAKRDVHALRRQHKLTVEEAARVARYSFLADVVKATTAVGVAVGHTANDQVETVLMHFVRGAGSGGMRGMRPIINLQFARLNGQPAATVRVLRPMLEVTRGEVTEYCSQNGLEPRVDASNDDLSYRRNQIRHELITIARRSNPRFEQAVLRSSRAAAAEDDYLSAISERELSRVAKTQEDEIVFDRPAWSALPRALQYRVLREAAAKLQGDLFELSTVHLEDAVEAINNKPAGSVIVWPRGLRVVQCYGEFALRRAARRESRLSITGEGVIVPAVNLIAGGQWQLAARITELECGWQPHSLHAHFEPSIVRQGLSVRRRRAGDRFQPAGMAQEKKLQDFFVDCKVPRDARDDVPILTAGGRIVWIAGHRVAEWAKTSGNGNQVLCLIFSHLD